jgi:hypothetical protein
MNKMSLSRVIRKTNDSGGIFNMMQTIPEIILERDNSFFHLPIVSPDTSKQPCQRAFGTNNCKSERLGFIGTFEQIQNDFVIHPLKAAAFNIFSTRCNGAGSENPNYFYRIK